MEINSNGKMEFTKIDERYGVSENGKVFDFEKQRVLSVKDNRQQQRVFVLLHERQVMLCRLVWETFCQKLNKSEIVQHDDGDYHNCSLWNLSVVENNAEYRLNVGKQRDAMLKALEKAKGDFEGVVTTENRCPLAAVKSDNVNETLCRLLEQMENYKGWSEELKWYLNSGEETVASGGWRNGQNYRDVIPQPYLLKGEWLPKQVGKKKKTTADREVKYHCLCLENGVIYNSYVHASQQLNLNEGTVRKACVKRGSVATNSKGEYHFRYIDAKTGEKLPYKEKRTVPHVKCIETGQIFVGLKAVKKSMGIRVREIKKDYSISVYGGFQFRLAYEDEVERFYA